MRSRLALLATGAAVLVGVILAGLALQTPKVRAVDEKVLREYAGVYQWAPDAFVYLQTWNEFGGALVAFDESGDIRTLYPTERDRFFAGPGAAVSTSVESRIEFQRDANGAIASLNWQRGGGPPRLARRVNIERHEDVRFDNGDVQLAGTLIAPSTGGKHPAIVLVHGSGPANRDSVLPLARFLI